MIDGLKSYAEMKPSGFAWLGDVPAHWDILRAKRLLRPTQLPVRPDDEIVTCFRNGEVTLRKNRRAGGFMVALLEQGYQGVRVGQLVVHSMDAFAGAIGVSDSDGKCTPEYIVCEPRSEATIPGYYSWVLRLAARTGYILASCPAVRERAPRLRYPDLAELRAPVPPLDEQRLIVRFLDWHGAQTAKLIRAKKKIIALLNEQKHAIIHRAVTRGLDPNVRLKPSGIPWLGDVPEGWNTISIGAASALIQTGPFGSQLSASAYASGGVPVINPSHLVEGLIKPEDQVSVPETIAERLERHRFAVGDLAIARRGELGRCSIVTERETGWICGTGTIRLTPRIDVLDVRFLALLLGDPLLRADLKAASIGATMDNLNEGMVGRLQIPLPSLSQQHLIVSFASELAESSRVASFTVEREITLIQEFRTRLIADVVTGKLDVRAVAASLPETVEIEATDELVEDDDLDEAIDNAENEEVAA